MSVILQPMNITVVIPLYRIKNIEHRLHYVKYENIQQNFDKINNNNNKKGMRHTNSVKDSLNLFTNFQPSK